ncbi:hypothetical protein MD484_g7395, partial [Candolleomyces efflorescens]
MSRLASIITPFSTAYRTDCSLEVVNFVKASPAVFVWLPASAFIRRNLLPRAKFAVAFHITTQRPFHSASLAYSLLTFSESNVRAGNYVRFDLVSLCYTFHSTSVVGILFYDDNFRAAFNNAISPFRRPHDPSVIWYDDLNNPVSVPSPSIVNGSSPDITEVFCTDLLNSVRYVPKVLDVISSLILLA